MAVKKPFIFILILFCICTFLLSRQCWALGPNKPTIAVLNFTVPEDEPELIEWGKRYTDFLTAELGKDNRFSVVERNQIDKMLQEIELKLSGLGSLEQSVAIGKMLGAEILVVGQLDRGRDKTGHKIDDEISQGEINIEVHLVQVSTGNILAREKIKCKQDELSSQTSKLSSFVLKSFSKITAAEDTNKESKTIALLRFKNKSKFKRLSYLEEELSRMLTDDLKQIPGLLVLEREYIEKILAEVKLTEFGLIEDVTAQRALGADYVISGSFEEKIKSGQPIEEAELLITVDMRDVPGRIIMGRIKISGKSKNLDQLQKNVILKIIETLDFPLAINKISAEIEKGRLLEASIHYIKGLQALGLRRPEEGLCSFRWQIGSKEQYRPALNEFQKSLYLNPRCSAELKFMIAVSCKMLGDRKKAINEFKQVINLFPESKWSGESLWELYGLYHGQLKGIDFLRQLVKNYPKHDRICSAYLFMAERHKYENEYLKAVESYSKYIDTFPSKWEYDDGFYVSELIDIVDCYLKINKPQKAVKVLEKAIEKYRGKPLLSILHVKLGNIYNDCYKKSKKAIVEYQAAIRCYQGYRTFRKLADAYLAIEMWKEAKDAYSQAIIYLSPESYDRKKRINSYLKKASACEHLKEWEEALKCYKTIAGEYDVTDKIKICYEKMGRDIPLTMDRQGLKQVRYTTENGLAHNRVTAVAASRDGIWIAVNPDWSAPLTKYRHSVGTKAIINYFDKLKHTWQKYGQEDDIVICPVTCITLDKNTVWFGTLGGGVWRYHKIENKWRNYTAKDGLLGDIVYAINVDDESIWFGGGSGGCRGSLNGWMCKINRSDEKMYAYIPPEVGFRAKDLCPSIISLKSDEHYVWAASRGNHMFCISKSTGNWKDITSEAYHNWKGNYFTSDDRIRAIETDDEYIWFATAERGLKRYNKTNNTWESFYASYLASYFSPSYRTESISANCELPDNRINCLAIDDNYVYVAAGGGLCAYSKKNANWIEIKPIVHDTELDSEQGYSTSGDEIRTLAVDEDSIWCGTESNGIIRYLKPHSVLTNDAGREKKH